MERVIVLVVLVGLWLLVIAALAVLSSLWWGLAGACLPVVVGALALAIFVGDQLTSNYPPR